MKNNTTLLAVAHALGAIGVIGALGMGVIPALSSAQIAGSSTVGISIAEMNEVVTPGWSVRKSFLGKTVYNEKGDKVGNVDDLILSPDKKLSYAIIGAGGFIGIGRHDVAIPIAQLQSRGGKIILPGATKEIVKAMPEFKYASEAVMLNQFIALAEQDISSGKAKLAELQGKAATAAADTKIGLNNQIADLQENLKATEDRLAKMKRAGVKSWKEFEVDMRVALSRLKASMKKAVS